MLPSCVIGKGIKYRNFPQNSITFYLNFYRKRGNLTSLWDLAKLNTTIKNGRETAQKRTKTKSRDISREKQDEKQTTKGKSRMQIAE